MVPESMFVCPSENTPSFFAPHSATVSSFSLGAFKVIVAFCVNGKAMNHVVSSFISM